VGDLSRRGVWGGRGGAGLGVAVVAPCGVSVYGTAWDSGPVVALAARLNVGGDDMSCGTALRAGETVLDVNLSKPGRVTGGAFGGEALGHLSAEGTDGVGSGG
jgi:hypothetical protein